MLVLLSLAFVTALSFFLSRYFKHRDCGFEEGFYILGWTLSFFLMIFLMIIPIQRVTSRGELQKLEALRLVYESDELKGESDRAGILIEVAKMNGELAESKYYASSLMWNWFWPKEVREAKYIQQ